MDKEDIFNLLTIQGRYKIIGSADTPHIKYVSDFDLQEHFSKTKVNKYPDKILSIFREKYRVAFSNPNIFIIDFKCGEIDGVPIRWDKGSIEKGFQKIGKKKITFQKALLMKSIIKMDIIAFIDDIACEFSENYYFKLNGFSNYCSLTHDELMYSLKEDIIDYYQEGNLFKSLKRVFAFLRHSKGRPTKNLQKKLIDFFNSQTGYINSIKNELEILKTLLENKFKPVKKELIRTNLTICQKQLEKITNEKLKSTAIAELEEIKKVPKTDMGGRIFEITLYLARQINRETKLFIEGDEELKPYLI